jgi:hypothetical protein
MGRATWARAGPGLFGFRRLRCKRGPSDGSDGLDTGDEHTKISVTVKSLVNELYLDDLRENHPSEASMGSFSKDTRPVGGTYGYRSEPVYDPTSRPDPRGRPVPIGTASPWSPRKPQPPERSFDCFERGTGKRRSRSG